jgi:hypothetical protein
MKHSITLGLQQITDLETLRTELATAGDKAYGEAAEKSIKAFNLRIFEKTEIALDVSRAYLDEATRLEAECDVLNDHGDKLMNQARIIHGILSEIKRNG